jgi:hypothetical protein
MAKEEKTPQVSGGTPDQIQGLYSEFKGSVKSLRRTKRVGVLLLLAVIVVWAVVIYNNIMSFDKAVFQAELEKSAPAALEEVQMVARDLVARNKDKVLQSMQAAADERTEKLQDLAAEEFEELSAELQTIVEERLRARAEALIDEHTARFATNLPNFPEQEDMDKALLLAHDATRVAVEDLFREDLAKLDATLESIHETLANKELQSQVETFKNDPHLQEMMVHYLMAVLTRPVLEEAREKLPQMLEKMEKNLPQH